MHIPKELVIFPNNHTKYDQGAIAAQNFHLVDVLNLVTRYLGQSATIIFSASKMGHELDALTRVG